MILVLIKIFIIYFIGLAVSYLNQSKLFEKLLKSKQKDLFKNSNSDDSDTVATNNKQGV